MTSESAPPVITIRPHSITLELLLPITGTPLRLKAVRHTEGSVNGWLIYGDHFVPSVTALWVEWVDIAINNGYDSECPEFVAMTDQWWVELEGVE